MPKIKAQPKHNPGKFRTHLAQAVKHLELAWSEHAKLNGTGLTEDQQSDWRVIADDLGEAATRSTLGMQRFKDYLRPTLPGYIEVQDVGEAEDEG